MPHEQGSRSESQSREEVVRPVRVTQARDGLRRDQSPPSMNQNGFGLLGLMLMRPAQQLVTLNTKCDEFTGAQRDYEKWKKGWKRFISTLRASVGDLSAGAGLLKMHVDTVTRARWVAMEDKGKNMTYDELWEDLEFTYGMNEEVFDWPRWDELRLV